MANTLAKFTLSKTNRLFSFVVYSNLWISIGATALTYHVYLINKIEVNWFYLLFVFGSTLLSYTVQRLFRIKAIADTYSDSWVVRNKNTAIVIASIGLLISFYCLAQFINFSVFLWLLPTGVISLFYSFKGLRDVPYLKIGLIGLSWGIICGVLPFVISGKIDSQAMLANFLWVMCYIIAITIPFDIRDLGLDEDSKRTIPQVLGEKNAKINAYLMLTISLIIYYVQFSQVQFFTYLFSVVIATALISKSSQKNSDLYFSFGVDGHIILQFLLVYFLC